MVKRWRLVCSCLLLAIDFMAGVDPGGSVVWAAGPPSGFDVNVINTPNVNVANPSSNPVRIRDVDNPAVQPFRAERFV